MQFKFLVVLFALLLEPFLASAAFTNPIKDPNGSDPFMVFHEGYYYLTSTTWTNIQLTRATTIAGLKTASPKTIWTDSTASRCCNIWAPEIHWQSSTNSWYIYYSAGNTGNLDGQKLHVLKGSSNIIWDSSWSYAGRLVPQGRDVWSIDGSILILGSAGTRYFVYSSWDGADQCIYIAQMTSPTTLGAPTKIATPTLSWERVGSNVNEGPIAIYGPTGRVFLVYSASGCAGTGYKLGRLELTGSNPLSASSWTKLGSPIFQSANGVYQPGHNGFFFSKSGNETWNVYHANRNSPGNCDGSRYTAVQKVNWNSDGTPNLGSPIALGTSIGEPV